MAVWVGVEDEEVVVAPTVEVVCVEVLFGGGDVVYHVGDEGNKGKKEGRGKGRESRSGGGGGGGGICVNGDD